MGSGTSTQLSDLNDVSTLDRSFGHMRITLHQTARNFQNVTRRRGCTRTSGHFWSTMTTIYLSQVPRYLWSSRFFVSLNVPYDQLDQFFFVIPNRCMKPNPDRIRSYNDLHHFLRTVCFWEHLELITSSPEFLAYVFNPRNKSSCLKAFESYDVDIPELHTIRTVLLAPKNERLMISAALGSLALVRYLCRSGRNGWSEVLYFAGRFGHTDLLRQLILNGSANILCSCDLIYKAVLENDVEFLTTAIAAGAKLSSAAANAAASMGRYDCLWHLISNNCPMDAETAAAAATNGHTDCLRLLLEVYQLGLPGWSDFFDYLRYGKPNFYDLACFQSVLSLGYNCTIHTFTNFVMGDRIDCVVWMVRNGYAESYDPCNVAVQCGNVDCLMALRAAGCEISADASTVAAGAGKKDVLIYLYAQGVFAGIKAITAAAENGHFSCLTLLHENDCPWDENTALAAGRRGRDFLRYVLRGGCPCAKTLSNTNAIVRGGDTNVLRFLHETQFPWDASTLVAIFTGDGLEKLSRLKYALQSGCPCDETLCSAAAEAGDLTSLKALLELGCPLDTTTFVGAARGGHLSMLEYLRTTGCYWGQSSFHAAIEGGHLSCVRYMVENNCPMDVMNAIDAAAKHGHVDVVKFLRGRRFPWTSNTCAVAASFGQLEVLKFLHANNCPWDEETCKRATPECLHFAVTNGCPGG